MSGTRTRKTIAKQIEETKVDASTMRKLRDEDGMSWEDIAKSVGLTNAGSAKQVYKTLVGVDPSGTVAGNRAPRGSRSDRAVVRPSWDDDADTDDITDTIDGRTIYVRRPGRPELEEVRVSSVLYFDTETGSGEPMDLTVTVIDRYSKAYRSFYVKDVAEVR